MKCDCVFPSERIRIKQSKGNDHNAYSRWGCMMFRCYNPKSKDYKNYGGRGILVCEQWHRSFDQFMKDVGDKPENMTIDRIINDGNYCPHNVEWASHKQQANNKRWNGVKSDLPKGVVHRKHLIKKPYMAQISINGKLKYIGSYSTPEEAGEAYLKARESSEELHRS